MSFFSLIFEAHFGVRRGSMGNPINLALNRSSEYFPWMFRGTICCLGFTWDRSTTLTVASQEFSQNSFSCFPSKKGLWSMASLGKLSHAQSEQIIRHGHGALWKSCLTSPCTALLQVSAAHTHCPELVLQFLPCCQGQNYSVQSIPAKCSSPSEWVLATSSKPGSRPQGGWERVTQRSEGRRYKLESGAGEERVPEQAGAAESFSTRWRVQDVAPGAKEWQLWACPVWAWCPSFPAVWQPQWHVQGRCSGHRWTWWREAVFAL